MSDEGLTLSPGRAVNRTTMGRFRYVGFSLSHLFASQFLFPAPEDASLRPFRPRDRIHSRAFLRDRRATLRHCSYTCSPRTAAASGRPASSSRTRRSASPLRRRFSKPAPAGVGHPKYEDKSVRADALLLKQPVQGREKTAGFTRQEDTINQARRDKLLNARWGNMRCVLTAYHFLMAITSHIYSVYLQRSITELP